MLAPPFLKKGDRIAIIAPGKKIDRDTVDIAAGIIESWGLHCTYAANLFSNAHPYLGGADAERLTDLQRAWNDPLIRGILCARGGYGTTRIVDEFVLEGPPKWIVGFSDVTALHLKLARAGIQSIHATMPILFGKEESKASVSSLKNQLFGKADQISFVSNDFNRPGRATGEVIGGNLSLLVESLGTPTEPHLDGKILIIEEVEEYRYKIDRMLRQLKRAGKLRNLAALVVGHFTTIYDSGTSFGETIEEIIWNNVREYHYPVVFGFPSGHENPNLAWTHGASYTLESDELKSVFIQA